MVLPSLHLLATMAGWWLLATPSSASVEISFPRRPQVDLGYSVYEGTPLEAGVNQFLGMRYAAPPVGELRWRAPVEPAAVGGVQKADDWGDFCFNMGPEPRAGQGEDCLRVHIWAPANATRESRLAVWVFIHGGGWYENSNARFNISAERAGCGGVEEKLECLRAVNASMVQGVNFPAPYPGGTADALWYWGVCVDGDLVRGTLLAMLEKGEFVQVPLVVGWNTDEGSYWAPDTDDEEELIRFLRHAYPLLSYEKAKEAASLYPPEQFGDGFPNRKRWFGSGSAAYGESILICSGINMARFMTKFGMGRKTWTYHYNVFDDVMHSLGIGVPHVAEFPSVFGPENVVYRIESYFTYNAPMVPIVMNYFISFVRSLDPNAHRHVTAPQWDSWASSVAEEGERGSGVDSRRLLLELGASRMQDTGEQLLHRCDFWGGLAETLYSFTVDELLQIGNISTLKF